MICDRIQCSACKSCVNKCPRQCITMVADSLDVPYPIIDKEKCIDCGLCRQACPNNNNLNLHEARKILAAWSLDSETRKKSASGGVAAELYKYAIENEWYTCGVIINHHKASFIEIKTIEDIQNVRNSKYVYSDTLDIYQRFQKALKAGKKALFIGLPCQVAGLYCFLGKTYQNLITVDIVCHGVVPDEYLRQHIEHIENQAKRKTTQVYFRNPDLNTYNYYFTLGDQNGLFYKKQVYEDDVYQLGYHKALIYRENCYHCQYAQRKRIGDLTICDFSAIGEIIPVKYDRMNVSCVLINSERGEKIINQLDGRLFWEPRPRSEAFNYETQLNQPYEKHPGRNTFVSEYEQNQNFRNAASKALKKELDSYNPSIFRKITLKAKRRIVNSTFYCKLKNKVARVIHYSNTPFGAVLMLHRVDRPDNNGIWYNQHLKLSPEVIEEMVSYARKRKCKFVSLDEMADAITKKKRHRRMIAVTLDDGYRDNFTNGLPLFTKLDVPFTIYVCTKMVNGKMLYWWEILEQLVLKHNCITLNDGRTFECTTKKEKEQAFLDIREILIKLPQNNLKEELKQLFEKYEIDYEYGNQNLGLTWNQIKELKESPLSTIGNHTYSHCAFTGCSDEDIISDIDLANKEMESRMDINMHHFAFPFGEAVAVSQHDIELIKQLKFRTSATTREDFIRYNTEPMNLPRIFITEKNWKQVIDKIADYC